MPEIGVLPFARAAMQVARAALPAYRSRFSEHLFTQPQLLAILCLMRYEDWTFREAEARLREHGELRAVLQLSSVPDYQQVAAQAGRRGFCIKHRDGLLSRMQITTYNPHYGLLRPELNAVTGGGRNKEVVCLLWDADKSVGEPRQTDNHATNVPAVRIRLI